MNTQLLHRWNPATSSPRPWRYLLLLGVVVMVFVFVPQYAMAVEGPGDDDDHNHPLSKPDVEQDDGDGCGDPDCGGNGGGDGGGDDGKDVPCNEPEKKENNGEEGGENDEGDGCEGDADDGTNATSVSNPMSYMGGEMLLLEVDIPRVAASGLRHVRSFRNRLSEDFDGEMGYNWQIDQTPALLGWRSDGSRASAPMPPGLENSITDRSGIAPIPSDAVAFNDEMDDVSHLGRPSNSTHVVSDSAPDITNTVAHSIYSGHGQAAGPDPPVVNKIAFVTGSNKTYWFDKIGSDWVPRHGRTDMTLVQGVGGEGYKYILTRLGNRSVVTYEFFDFSTNVHLKGAMMRRIDAGGIVTEASYGETGIESLTQTVTSGGTTTIYKLAYVYNTAGRISSVSLLRKVGSGSWESVRSVGYTYYDGISDTDEGATGDLKAASVRLPDGTGGTYSAYTTYYRYYTAAYSGNNPGRPHLLKYKVGPEGWRLLEQSGDPFEATDTDVAEVADYYFEYDDEDRITLRRAAPWCSSCSGTQTAGETFEREEEDLTGDPPTDYSSWKWKVTRTFPDGNREVVYTNKYGQVILRIFQEMDGQTVDNEWITFYKRNDKGYIVMTAMPSAVTGYDEDEWDLLEEDQGNYTYLSDSAGLIYYREYSDSTTSGIDDTSNSGDVTDYLKARYVQHGETGDLIKLREYEYFKHEADGQTVCPLAKVIEYPDEDDLDHKMETAYYYEWQSDSMEIAKKYVVPPVVPTSQNGPSQADIFIEYAYDAQGRVEWMRNERGIITYFQRDAISGRLLKKIVDVNTSLSGINEPSGTEWDTTSGLHLTYDYEYDSMGRLTQVLGPEHEVEISGNAVSVRSATWHVRHENANDELDEFWTGRGYLRTDTSAEVLVDPVSLYVRDKIGRIHDHRLSRRTSGSGELTATDTFAQGDWSRWTKNIYDDETQKLVATRIYHGIPSSGEGDLVTNYHQASYGYDPTDGRLVRTVGLCGTITWNIYDVRDRLVQRWIGTDSDGADPGDTDPSASGTNDMKLVAELEYDDGGVGDGYLTQVTRHVDDSTTRVTEYSYDFRGRRISATGEENLYVEYEYDNLDRLVLVESFDGPTGNRLSHVEINHDDRNRVYETVFTAVDPDTGNLGEEIASQSWFDPEGNVIKQVEAGDGETFSKFLYDGLGRVTAAYTGYDPNGSDDPHASDLDSADDIFVEQVWQYFDEADNLIQVNSYQRHPDDTSMAGELDTDIARITYQAMWYAPGNRADRQIASADYGTNGGSAPTRPSTTPTPSDTVLVSTTAYDDASRAYLSTDPAGIVTKRWFDDRNRTTHVIENYDSDGGLWTTEPDEPDARDPDVNRITAYTYTPRNQLATITAIDPDHDGDTSDDQVTTYVYGTTLTDSAVASTRLLRAVIYPESDDPADLSDDGTDETFDRVELTYNRLGQPTQYTDQREVVHQYEYDDLGRLLHDKVTDLGRGGENVDDTVRRISRTYEVRGMLANVTSYDNATPGSGSALNEVEMSYDDFGVLIAQAQDHSTTVSGGSPKVQYAYTSGSGNVLRATGITYPNSRQIAYEYGTSGGVHDRLNRIAAIKENTTTLAAYDYLGMDSIVKLTYAPGSIDVALDYDRAGDQSFAALDHFGRVVDHHWEQTTTPTTLDRYTHAYDRASNRLYRENTLTTGLDELYAYDGLHRLTSMQRGDLNGTKDELTGTVARAEDWTLDHLGNWAEYAVALSGSVELAQERLHNTANEITQIAETTGSSWVDPAHDAAGNMTLLPKPGEPDEGFEAIYDAWNRLVKLIDADTEDTVAEYEWDGLGWRIVKKTYTGQTLDETRHFYYTEAHQIVEERVDGTSSADARIQYVWDIRYIDALVLRDRDMDDDGDLSDERLYALQDSQFNVTALVNDSSAVVERYSYTPYGERTVLNANWTEHSNPSEGSYSFAISFQGLMRDAETGLIYNRARMLHPQLGRFMQRDPIEYVNGMNLYEYVLSSPIAWLDPTGLRVVIKSRRIYGPGGAIGCHTWVEVIDEQTGERTTYSGIDDDGRLRIFKNWPDDKVPYRDRPEESSEEVPCPDGMSQEEWDDAVQNAGDDLVESTAGGNNWNYSLFGNSWSLSGGGNCHNATTTIIHNAGGRIPPGYDPPGREPGLGDPLPEPRQ